MQSSHTLPQNYVAYCLRVFASCLVALGPLAAKGQGAESVAVDAVKAWTRPDARYAEPASCRECHDELCQQWNGSDHHRAMDDATPATVLGDFGTTFFHFGFDDTLALTDADLRTILAALWAAPRGDALRDATAFYSETYENYDRAGRKRQPRRDATFDDLALALRDAKTGVAERLVASMTPEEQQAHRDEVAFLELVAFWRPGEIAAAQHRIARLVRRLVSENAITLPTSCRVSRFEREGDDFFVETDGEDGLVARFRVAAVLGVRPLQQYLVSSSRGRVQVLPLAWDAVCGEWFHLYPKEQINADDPLHWTHSLQNWNTMCADCHTTDLKKSFDVATQTYKTTFVEKNVGCQSCHGPCGDHVTRARERNLVAAWDDKSDLGTFRFSRATSQEAIDSCAACHARRRWLTAPPMPSGAPLLDHAVPEILDGTLYYADGQLREEAFEYASFSQAKMLAMGVRCTDCHDPHTAQLVRSGNRLCTQCHSPQLYDTPLHHFHTDTTRPGTMCVECHMPEAGFMVIDPRRDHSIRKPQPDWTVALGVPNACNSCHRDRQRGETAAWAAAKCDEWYRVRRETHVGFAPRSEAARNYASVIAAGRAGERGAAERLLSLLAVTEDKEVRPIVRASAAILLGQQQPPLPSEAWDKGIAPLLGSPDPLLRYAATVAMESRTPQECLKLLVPRLQDPVRGVRCEAARLLAGVSKAQLTPDDATQRQVALRDYIAAQNIVSDQAAAHLNVAIVLRQSATPALDDVATWLTATLDEAHRARRPETELDAAVTTARRITGQLTDAAVARYKTSLTIDPQFIPSRVNLAMLHHERGENREAETQFQEVLRIDPTFGDAAYSLGLLLAEEARWDDSVTFLQQAATLMPRHARVKYNLGLAFDQLEKWDDAATVLREAIAIDTASVDVWHALVLVLTKSGRREEALEAVTQLIRLDPQNPQWNALRQSLLTREGR